MQIARKVGAFLFLHISKLLLQFYVLLLRIGEARHHVVEAMREVRYLRRAAFFHTRAVITTANGPKRGGHLLQERQRSPKSEIDQHKDEHAEQREDRDRDLEIAPGLVDLVMRNPLREEESHSVQRAAADRDERFVARAPTNG